ncbi:MAG: NAD-dependent epimerase/dehydratase family protein [Clostridia bacterium]|nr:NAD-dependent epimerase/dehydratase family protein [Clostridia bacterium]
MNVLILGGSGFVSGYLTRAALDRGYGVWTVTRGSRSQDERIHALHADRNDRGAMAALIADLPVRMDAVLDCICYNAEQAKQDMDLFAGVTDRIIVISTDSVYHPAFKRCPQDENGERYLTDGGYGARKREMELAFINGCPPELKWTIFRPGHIFGPGSEAGCFPEQSRQPELLRELRSGKPMRLVGGGKYLIHPIYAGDLVRVMLDCIPNEKTFDQMFCIGGPDAVPNYMYYEILSGLLGVKVTFETIPEEGYLEAHPSSSGHLCDRCYDLSKLAAAGIRLPDMPLREGLRLQVEDLIARGR